MLKIENRIGKPESKTSGIDTLSKCRDKKHYLSFPKKISYKYNSKGFRDEEWPVDMSDVIWCVGDSFTVGIGQPYEETWPYLLGKTLGKRCINLGEDGCSNDTMALRIQEICKLHSPKLIVVMWSYLARRRVNGENVEHDKKDFGVDEDLANFLKNYETVNSLPTNIINLLIPFAFENIEMLKTKYPNLVCFAQLDYARDHHHFDVKTSKGVCQLIERRIKKFDNSSK
jgi:hypothetical protein